MENTQRKSFMTYSTTYEDGSELDDDDKFVATEYFPLLVHEDDGLSGIARAPMATLTYWLAPP